jgi:hypothetical protein
VDSVVGVYLNLGMAGAAGEGAARAGVAVRRRVRRRGQWSEAGVRGSTIMSEMSEKRGREAAK